MPLQYTLNNQAFFKNPTPSTAVENSFVQGFSSNVAEINLKGSGYRLLLAFGSNLGNRQQNLNSALSFIRQYCRVLRCSQWQKTQPLKSFVFDTSSHEYYLNFVAEVCTALNPYEFYHSVIVKIEDKLGHSRQGKWMPRALDIDVVFAAQNDAPSFADCTPIVLHKDNFCVPHCDYFQRDFWREMIEVQLKYDPKR